MNEALVLLVLIWAAVLVPRAFRSRNTSPHATVGGFERAMDVLRTSPGGRGGGGRELLVPADAGRIVDHAVDHREEPAPDPGPAPAATRAGVSRAAPVARHEDPVVARRRARFLRLLVATAATLVAAVVFGGWLWAPFVAVAVTLAGYVVLLRRLKLQRDQARRVVAELELHRAGVRTPAAVAAGDEPWSSSVRLRRWDD